MTLHLMSVYADAGLRKWFEAAYKKSGKKLDMGKACLRFKTLDALPLDVIGETVSRVPVDKYVASYEKGRPKPKQAAKKAAAKKKPKKAANKSAKKKPKKKR